MCDPHEQGQKWKCEYCTYENFPSAIKCTMCKGLKPLLNEDIFRLSPPQSTATNVASSLVEASSLSLSQSNLSACGLPLQESSKSKWSCRTCTYFNWPRSLRCVQCYTKRSNSNEDMYFNDAGKSSSNRHTHASPLRSPKASPPPPIETAPAPTSTSINDDLNFLNNISGSDPDLMASSNNLASSKISPIGSITNLASSRNSLTNSQTAAGAVATRVSPVEATTPQHHTQQRCLVAKWACNVCTYENWPKSLKCSMCGRAKDALICGNEGLSCSNKALADKDEGFGASNNTLSNNTFNNKHRYQLGSSETINNCDTIQERQERRQRQIRRQVDWQWLNACLGVVENNHSAVEAYLSCGGNPARSLTSSEIAALNRNSAFDVGHTLIHLAIRFHREEMLPMLLAQISGSGPGIKRVPSYVAPDLAADIRRHFANTLRMRKSLFNCHYVQEHATFALPVEIEELPIPIQEQLYDELLDRDAQKQLETPPPALNWCLEITARLGSRLFVLWNRSAGDCLLDSAMQSTWGVFDRDNTLRRALADSLHQCGPVFYSRWREYEMIQAAMNQYTLEEAQWEEDWSTLLSLASQPGSSLEQLHIFTLAHILRRPIIVYGVKYVKSFRGEDIGVARFEGLYLPLFWDQNFCIKSPIALGYTRGHFSALVPMEPYARIDARRDEPGDVTFLPLMDCESKLLPIHFLTQAEMGREETIMRQWLDVCVTEGGLLVAQQKLRKRPLLVAQMLEEWLNHYRRIAQVIAAPFGRRPQTTGYSSEGDTDEE
ncbi:ubiquitin thioesterase trabid isoform X1 [Eupeodes corollae]|uniref:ubiquitin thioesterase trabid isoform X1 n=2 Tax=Eupeodes corollae TaxID=290404 RepID=UPI0024938795|nr:ubiquitin thioesterase trabid isoform X1 [Eupeodes corollae]XP_055907628.1 ubiquitin thioesterase trabid isoform X1 [Eupeodes corollae]